MNCERCLASPFGFELLDYCADCSTNLCKGCMEDGCCGNVPAISGTTEDFSEEE